MRSDIGKECSHTYLCGPSDETIAFLDHARDANIATAIPRPAGSCQKRRWNTGRVSETKSTAATPCDRNQTKITACFVNFHNVHLLCDVQGMSTTCADDHRKPLSIFQPDDPEGQEAQEIHDRCPGSRGNSALENPVQQLCIVRLSMHGSIAAQIGLWSTCLWVQASLTQTTR